MRRALLFLSATTGAAAAAIACSSPDPREQFDPSEAGTASLPEASAPGEASAPIDAGVKKPPFDPSDEPVTCTTTPCAVQIVAGENHFCARTSDGNVRCWGDNTRGTLGVDDAGVFADPVGDVDGGDGGWFAPVVEGLTGVTQLSAGGATTCAVVGDGGVSCWGSNATGQLGLSASAPIVDTARHPHPTQVALPAAVKRADVGVTSACAVLMSGEAWCWGDNSRKQLARMTSTNVGVPAKAELGALPIARTAAGTYSAFAVTQTGGVVSWGAVAGPEGSVSGRLGSVLKDVLPGSIELGAVTSLSVSSTRLFQPPSPKPPRGIGHACAVAKGEVFCWGDSLAGALGTIPEPVPAPHRAALSSDDAWAQQVAAGGDITCVRLTDGSVECAGENALGALGKDPKAAFSMIFVPVPSFEEHAVQIAVASGTVCALVQGGRVVCWGANGKGELGQSTRDGDPHPMPAFVRF